jgi:DNA-binding NarL/FixJ family response regulator
MAMPSASTPKEVAVIAATDGRGAAAQAWAHVHLHGHARMVLCACRPHGHHAVLQMRDKPPIDGIGDRRARRFPSTSTALLPAPIDATSGLVVRPEGSEPKPMQNVGNISDIIERSVLKNLSSQLSTMFTATRQSSERTGTSARRGNSSPVAIRLSKSQLQVLRLLGEGKTNKEIAQVLFRSPNTIKLHVSAILHRLS